MTRRCARLAVAVAVCELVAGIAAASTAFGQGLDEQALALRFRPLLHFHPEERWRPLNVDFFLRERLRDGLRHRLCIRLRGDDPCNDVPSDGALANDRRAYVDLHGERDGGRDAASPYLAGCGAPAFLRDCDRGRRSVLYYNATLARGRLYLDYWWFFRFNEYLPDHEGDWEGVTLVLEPGLEPTIDYVAFSAHGKAFRYPRGVATFAGGSHVRVYVARGSHASYPRPCRRFCRQTGVLRPERSFPNGPAWGRTSDRECGGRCVLPLPERDTDPTVFGAANASDWNGWPGRWGKSRFLSRKSKGPLSPSRQGRYQTPWRHEESRRTDF